MSSGSKYVPVNHEATNRERARSAVAELHGPEVRLRQQSFGTQYVVRDKIAGPRQAAVTPGSFDQFQSESAL
jgi:hypothetical protein